MITASTDSAENKDDPLSQLANSKAPQSPENSFKVRRHRKQNVRLTYNNYRGYDPDDAIKHASNPAEDPNVVATYKNSNTDESRIIATDSSSMAEERGAVSKETKTTTSAKSSTLAESYRTRTKKANQAHSKRSAKRRGEPTHKITSLYDLCKAVEPPEPRTRSQSHAKQLDDSEAAISPSCSIDTSTDVDAHHTHVQSEQDISLASSSAKHNYATTDAHSNTNAQCYAAHSKNHDAKISATTNGDDGGPNAAMNIEKHGTYSSFSLYDAFAEGMDDPERVSEVCESRSAKVQSAINSTEKASASHSLNKSDSLCRASSSAISCDEMSYGEPSSVFGMESHAAPIDKSSMLKRTATSKCAPASDQTEQTSIVFLMAAKDSYAEAAYLNTVAKEVILEVVYSINCLHLGSDAYYKITAMADYVSRPVEIAPRPRIYEDMPLLAMLDELDISNDE